MGSDITVLQSKLVILCAWKWNRIALVTDSRRIKSSRCNRNAYPIYVTI
jgi:hypothetical protein